MTLRRWEPVALSLAAALLAVAALLAAGSACIPGPARAADPDPAARSQAVVVPAAAPDPAEAKGDGKADGKTDAKAGPRCLTRAEQRASSAAHTVIPLAKAVQAVKARRGELLRARLCEQNGRLVYQLTILPRGGKIQRATVDAGNGTLLGGP